MKFYCHTATLIHLCIIFGYHCATTTGEYLGQRGYGPRSLKYLLSSTLQKNFASPKFETWSYVLWKAKVYLGVCLKSEQSTKEKNFICSFHEHLIRTYCPSCCANNKKQNTQTKVLSSSQNLPGLRDLPVNHYKHAHRFLMKSLQEQWRMKYFRALRMRSVFPWLSQYYGMNPLTV